ASFPSRPPRSCRETSRGAEPRVRRRGRHILLSGPRNDRTIHGVERIQDPASSNGPACRPSPRTSCLPDSSSVHERVLLGRFDRSVSMARGGLRQQDRDVFAMVFMPGFLLFLGYLILEARVGPFFGFTWKAAYSSVFGVALFFLIRRVLRRWELTADERTKFV